MRALYAYLHEATHRRGKRHSYPQDCQRSRKGRKIQIIQP